MASINAGLALRYSSLPTAMPILADLARLVESEIDGFFPLTFCSGRKKGTIGNAIQLLEKIKGETSGQFSAQGCSDIEPDFSYSVSGEMAELQFVCDIGHGRISPNFADGFAKILIELCEKNIEVSGICALGIRNMKIRRVRPPRYFGPIDTDAVVDLVPTKLSGNLAQQMLDGQLPDVVEKTTSGSAVVICWSPNLDLENLAAIKTCLERKQQWLNAALKGVLADGWNDAGDSAFDIFSAAPLGGLSLYDSATEHGFLTLHDSEPQREKTERIKKFLDMLAIGTVPETDLPLSGGAIIANSRNAAIALQSKFSDSPIKWFLYPDGERLFNPFPDGEWQN